MGREAMTRSSGKLALTWASSAGTSACTWKASGQQQRHEDDLLDSAADQLVDDLDAAGRAVVEKATWMSSSGRIASRPSRI